MAQGGLFKPSAAGRRDQLSNAKQNGRVVNPPRFPEMGGFTSASKGFKRNDKSIVKPGGTK